MTSQSRSERTKKPFPIKAVGLGLLFLILGISALLFLILGISALSVLKKPETTTTVINHIIDQGVELCREGNYQEGLALLQETAERAHRLNFTTQESYAHYYIGGFQLSMLENEYSGLRAEAALKGLPFKIPPERFIQAELNLQTAIRLLPSMPENFQVHHMLGFIYREQRKYLNAVASFNESIKLNKDYAQAHNDLGEAYFALGQYDDANTAFKLALHIDEKFFSAHFNLGLFYSSKEIGEEIPKSKELAIEHLTSFLNLTTEENAGMPERITAQKILNELSSSH